LSTLAIGSILLSPVVFLPPFCPASALLRGYYGMLGFAFGPVGAVLGMTVLGLGIFMPWSMGIRRPHKARLSPRHGWRR
jgi:hypothetical protein